MSRTTPFALGPAGDQPAGPRASASLVELGGSAGPPCHTFHARDPWAHETVDEIDEAQARAFFARHG
ncbi:hypothetical protein ABT075_39965 [Streptomyces sp. NPDC002677]|uniref:hypothetical protein n=1 Tax=Streptomyces sp. NPDC002677 TaxID=3154774 RepID=UPI0033336BB2